MVGQWCSLTTEYGLIVYRKSIEPKIKKSMLTELSQQRGTVV